MGITEWTLSHWLFCKIVPALLTYENPKGQLAVSLGCEKQNSRGGHYLVRGFI